MWNLGMAAGLAAMLGMATSAFAQTTPPAAAPPAAAKAVPKATTKTKERSAESMECSKQADAKGLHGKERKTFRASCLQDLKKKS